MKEYMFYIRNAGDAKAALSSEEHLAFVKKCEVYIGQLKAEGKLIAAQPMVREGFVISKSSGSLFIPNSLLPRAKHEKKFTLLSPCALSSSCRRSTKFVVTHKD